MPTAAADRLRSTPERTPGGPGTGGTRPLTRPRRRCCRWTATVGSVLVDDSFPCLVADERPCTGRVGPADDAKVRARPITVAGPAPAVLDRAHAERRDAGGALQSAHRATLGDPPASRHDSTLPWNQRSWPRVGQTRRIMDRPRRRSTLAAREGAMRVQRHRSLGANRDADRAHLDRSIRSRSGLAPEGGASGPDALSSKGPDRAWHSRRRASRAWACGQCAAACLPSGSLGRASPAIVSHRVV
jgi:hypothetical protein